MTIVKDIFDFSLGATLKGGEMLLKGYLPDGKSGARFAKPKEYHKYLNAKNTGLLLDGQALRLTERESFQNACVIARVGAGKTSRFIIPNVLDKADRQCSLVVNDPKGEVFAATSAHMHAKGFDIYRIDPENPHLSHRFNPLLEARDGVQLEQIAEILMMAGNPGDRDPFWNRGAMRFVGLFLKGLANAGAEDPRLFTLANLNHMLQHFGENGRALDEWMALYSMPPDNPNDATLWNEWQGLLTGNKEGIQSFVLNALTALRALSNPKVAWVTGGSDFELATLRQRKTVLYIVTPPQYADYYAFLTSVIFRSVFNAAMRSVPGPRDLPLYVFYDEFGHSTLPGFVATANTIRAYKVSLTIVLQSMAQLASRYGPNIAQAIQGGFNTYVTYAGADPETAQFFERVVGKVRERDKPVFFGKPKGPDTYREYNLINANEVRTLKDDEGLIVASNRNPILLKTHGYFEESRYRRAIEAGALAIVPRRDPLPPLKFIDL